MRSDSADLDARLLLQQALAVEYSYLLAHADDTLSTAAITHYFALLARAERGEPLPYIKGRVPFRFVEIAVPPAVLIPRPETEQLVELAVAWAKRQGGKQTIVDVGSGSGCIAISMAQELPDANVIGVEISADALKIAQQNGQTNHVTIDWRQGSLLEPIEQTADLIIANLPYVAEPEREILGHSVAGFEPDLALFGGADGLGLIRELVVQAKTTLSKQGALFLEIGFQQGDATLAVVRQHFPADKVICQQDYAGNDRFIMLTRCP